MESNHHGCFHPQGPQAEPVPHGRAENGLWSQVRSDYIRLKPVVSGSDWRTAGARTVRSRMTAMMRVLPLGGVIVATALLMLPSTAGATKPCQAVIAKGEKRKVGVVGVPCDQARKYVEDFYERWQPERGYYPIDVEGFQCRAGSAGTDVGCQRGDLWIFATSRPYADITDFHPPQKAIHRRCGRSQGRFKVYGAPDLRAEVHDIRTRNVICSRGKRFAHRLFFRQECIYCDAEDSYDYGDRIRFRGFQCRVGRGEPQTFRCRRGAKRINFRTATLWR
jgi:hypothetical protein